MDDQLWHFVDTAANWMSHTYATPKMTGRVLGWLLVCDPVEQTAAQLAEELDASKGAISGATGTLVRSRLVERLHVRGERAERFRLRPGAWDDQVRDRAAANDARELIALGLASLGDVPAARRARLEELAVFYTWWESRMDSLWDEWQEYKREHLGGGGYG
jgi:DNA-binding transcriptional regulator GbsR (MarR family)